MSTQPSPEYVVQVLAEVERRNQQRLKPCNRCTPLIGNGVLLTLFHSTESDIGGYYPASVMCNQCRRQIWGGKTDESAIKVWNKTQGRTKISDRDREEGEKAEEIRLDWAQR
jgi:hypothetical protein